MVVEANRAPCCNAPCYYGGRKGRGCVGYVRVIGEIFVHGGAYEPLHACDHHEKLRAKKLKGKNK